MLEAIGLTTDEESVYRALVGRAAAGAPEVAADLGLDEETVATSLERLSVLGIATPSPHGHVAAPPAVALGAMITERREALRLAEQALATLTEEHRAAVAGRDIAELLEVVRGGEAVRHRFLQVQRAAQAQLRLFVTAPFTAVAPEENPAEEAALARGVQVRVIMERSVLEEPGLLQGTLHSLRNGALLRVVDELPMKLVLADADLGLVPLTSQPSDSTEPAALLLHRSGLLAGLTALFEATWRRAFELDAARLGEAAADAEQAIAEVDRRILTLLLAGLTDQAVAGQLDISLRTVQRRLRVLMEFAGVDTRLQLGWHAAREGWA